MIFEETPLKGSYIIKLEELNDNRGFFSRTFCENEFKERNLEFNFVQSNISFNYLKGTLRGIHYQEYPFEEAKLVRCINGSAFDVIVDLRKNSATYCQWFSIELSNKNRLSLYIPKGFGHAYQTLEDNTEVFYQMSDFYNPDYSKGIRWNDPLLNIDWKIRDNLIISEKDKNWNNFK